MLISDNVAFSMKGKKPQNQLMMDYSLHKVRFINLIIPFSIIAILVSRDSSLRYVLGCGVQLFAYCMYLWTFPLVRCFKIEKSNNIIDNNISNLFLVQKVLTILKYVGSKSEWVLFRGWGGGDKGRHAV